MLGSIADIAGVGAFRFNQCRKKFYAPALRYLDKISKLRPAQELDLSRLKYS
jgi:hypothetical protein